MSHASHIRDKRPNSKFCRGSKDWADRQAKLKEILARMIAGRSFSDLQGG